MEKHHLTFHFTSISPSILPSERFPPSLLPFMAYSGFPLDFLLVSSLISLTTVILCSFQDPEMFSVASLAAAASPPAASPSTTSAAEATPPQGTCVVAPLSFPLSSAPFAASPTSSIFPPMDGVFKYYMLLQQQQMFSNLLSQVRKREGNWIIEMGGDRRGCLPWKRREHSRLLPKIVSHSRPLYGYTREYGEWRESHVSNLSDILYRPLNINHLEVVSSPLPIPFPLLYPLPPSSQNHHLRPSSISPILLRPSRGWVLR